MAKKPDPTKDPEFQKVVQHLLTTPPRHHSEMKLGNRKAKAGAQASQPRKRERRKKHGTKS
jgi:hypothetical protein